MSQKRNPAKRLFSNSVAIAFPQEAETITHPVEHFAEKYELPKEMVVLALIMLGMKRLLKVEKVQGETQAKLELLETAAIIQKISSLFDGM
jgi:hypothetical protein